MNRNLKILCPEYRTWTRKRPCLINADCAGPKDFDHVKARGLGAGKQNDFTGVCLCRKHHSERGQIGDEKFQAKYRVNLYQEITFQLIEFFALDPERRAETVIIFGHESPVNGPWGKVG